MRRTVFYPEKTGINYITVRGFTLRARGHALGAAHGRADRLDRHALEQRLDHREQRDQPLDMFGHRAGQIRRRVGQHVGRIRRRLRRDHRARPRRTAGTRKPSATTSSATTPSPTANRPASSAAWAPRSASSPATPSMTSTSGSCSRGAEMAGIKFHGAIDVEISRNHIYRTCRGLWLDWMAQGTRVSGKPLPRQPEPGLVRRSGSRTVPGGQQPLPLAAVADRRFAGRRLRSQPDRRRHRACILSTAA